MAQTREIRIRDGYTNGTLNLSSNHLHADKKDTILWTVKEGILVDSIERIEIKTGSANIFESFLYNGNSCEGTIKANAAGKKCEYSIVWKDYDGNEYTFDPIISVRPSGPLAKIIIGFSLAVLAFLTLQFLRKQKSKIS